eukprot:gene20175-22150_t
MSDTNIIVVLLSLLMLLLSCVDGRYVDGGGDADETKLSPTGANVCSYIESRPVKVNVSTTVTTFVSFLVKKRTGWWRRTSLRTIYKSKLKTVYHMMIKMKEFNVYYCCNGWTRGKGSNQCLIPICGIPCMNGGKCVAPDQCDCPKGFQGPYCNEDVNECRDRTLNKCQHYCVNTQGSFHCRCRDGFLTDKEDPTLCQDINECEVKDICQCPKGDRNCNATCVNTPGSYQCSCSKGYTLRGFDGVCTDRNECIDDVCEHRCTNTPGSYECSCFLGFQLNTTTGRCEDIDECKIDNGGCNHQCHNVYGGSVCSCKAGFYLDNDLQTCKEITPTVKSLDICDRTSFNIISCDWPREIKVLYAFYGRVLKDVCPSRNATNDTEDCIINGATKSVSKWCDNKIGCYIDVPTIVKQLKDTCKNTSKYLQIFYRCINSF